MVDVGADHGRLARAVGAVAVERLPHRKASPEGTWVISDGLSALRGVGTAVIAGMGADRIAGILVDTDARRVVAHAQDDPPRLRAWLAANGWRIVDERVAREGRRWTELVAAERGAEPTAGARLRCGPVLASRPDDPDVRAAFTARRDRLARDVAAAQAAGQPADERVEDLAWLDAWLGDGHTAPDRAILAGPER